MTKTRQLLVVGKQPETGEVLKAVLEREQTEVTSVRTWRQLDRQSMRPDGTVLVVHGDQDLPEHPDADPLRKLPRVVIGRARVNQSYDGDVDFASRQNDVAQTSFSNDAAEDVSQSECCLDELFEYRDLFNAIETLWNRAG